MLRWLKMRIIATVMLACTTSAAAVLVDVGPAQAAIVPTVELRTAASYAVLAGSAVTNTGASTLNGSLGLSPGTSVTGFPPGQVVPPGTSEVNNAAAQQAQSDLTAAYADAASRPINATTSADLANLTLQPGVYAGPSKGALSLTGPLTLDGGGDVRSVFVFQTDSTLTTASGSRVTLINGAQECNVFWLVGSSATLGTSSTFAGTVLALTSVTVTTGTSVRGRTLARNGAVTLDTDTFSTPTCAQSTAVTTTTTTTTTAPTTTTTRTTPSTGPTPPTTTLTGADSTPLPTSGTPVEAPSSTPVLNSAAPGSPELPRTGRPIGAPLVVGILALALGSAALRFSRSTTSTER